MRETKNLQNSFEDEPTLKIKVDFLTFYRPKLLNMQLNEGLTILLRYRNNAGCLDAMSNEQNEPHNLGWLVRGASVKTGLVRDVLYA